MAPQGQNMTTPRVNEEQAIGPLAPFVTVMDEVGYYFGGTNDDLKEQLRSLDGVPNATYLVDHERVFVFEKLLQLVSPLNRDANGKVDGEEVLALMPQAWVGPVPAVESLGVLPKPYKLEESAGGFTIVHGPFNAVLGAAYPSKSEAQKALARLLVGDAVSDAGDFGYRGQRMTLRDSLDWRTLPSVPPLDVEGLEAPHYVYKSLSGCSFIEGLQPLAYDDFAKLTSLESEWSDASGRARRYANARADDLWKDTAGYGFGALNNAASVLGEYEAEDGRSLRDLYPELAMLNEGSLYDWFDAYQNECVRSRSWDVSRDDGFLFYLIGAVATTWPLKDERARAAGELAGFAMLKGQHVQQAFAFARDCGAYDLALCAMAHRAAEVMRYLAAESNATDLRGDCISTFGDLARAGRKFSVHPVSATQAIGDFTATTSQKG